MAYVCGGLLQIGVAILEPKLIRLSISFSGKLFGKTPLIKLSPKKTVEGFVGAFFCTLLFALIVSLLLRS